jgi:hypothetical protein
MLRRFANARQNWPGSHRAFGAAYEHLLTLSAFGVASLAVQNWRELSVLVATTAALYWPVK